MPGRVQVRRRPRLAGVLTLCGLSACSVGCGWNPLRRSFTLRVAGAQIPVELVTSWLNEADEVAFVVTPATIYLSQHGFDALRRGECDLACTDRVIEPRELEAFEAAKPVGYRVAYYGYGLYVNVENTVDAIFARHIAMVFQKQVTDWKQLGGPEIPIRLYGPQKETRGGQILARQARIWFDRPTWEPLDTPEEIIRRVEQDPGGLGFAPIGYDGTTRYLGIRMARNADPAWPSLEEIEAGRYGFAKLVYVYALPPPSPGVQAAIDYLYGPRGAAAIEATDVRPIPFERARVAAEP